nr:MAG TPA: hypothetical protein [Caudoviricetes sp.]
MLLGAVASSKTQIELLLVLLRLKASVSKHFINLVAK